MSNPGILSEPRWLKDLGRFLPIKSQFVLTGNVRDFQVHQVGSALTTSPLETVIAGKLAEAGVADVLLYDPVSGFRLLERPDGSPGDMSVFTTLGLTAVNGTVPASLDLFSATLERIARRDGSAIAVIANFASRLVVRVDALSPVEHQLFTRALVLSQSVQPRPVGRNRSPLFNNVIWVADKEGDLPDWLWIHNPRIRHIPISTPDRAVRRAIAPNLIRSLPGAREATPEDLREAETELVDGTEGMLLVDMNAVGQLARSESVPLGDIGEAVRRYKVGVTDDPWKKLEQEKIRSGEKFIARRLVGQDHAITHMLDIVKRAATGVTGAKRGGRPRGVAFLAGPTGVGKTELAKTVTELLFGDESAYIRFDMSEFSAEHADQRLIGAPPGYVGYDVGGELTNAIREKPFSVLLFDEIEKAHPRILDKFLQVLDDGVLTSGRGDRVYFSEALIVFTSNLGIYSTDALGSRTANVTPENSFAEVKARVRSEIENHFKLVLNRPEILNRIGENIIVFDFIRPEVADQIFESMINRILLDCRDSGYDLTLAVDVRNALKERCTNDLSNGGRGIRNQLEAHFINPLSRALFECGGMGSFLVSKVDFGQVTSLVIQAVQ